MGRTGRVFALASIMAVVALSVGGVAIWVLYETALAQQGARLEEIAQSQARTIEAVAHFDRIHHHDHPGGPLAVTLSTIRRAHARYRGFGETGEFVLARRRAGKIEFLVRHRHRRTEPPRPVSVTSRLAEPMRRALRGKSGLMVGLDYRGATVLAAFEPVRSLGLGIVVKIDLREMRAPFLKAGGLVAGIALVLIALGVALFLRVGQPMVRELEERERQQRALMDYAPALMFSKDREGRYRAVNRRFEQVLGPTADEVRGRTDAQLFSAPVVTALTAGDREVFEEAHAVVSEEKIPSVDGPRIYLVHKFPLLDRRGRPRASSAIAFDITERKRAEGELRHLTGLLVTAQEEERRSVARELHDNLSQTLAALAIEVEEVQGRLVRGARTGEPVTVEQVEGLGGLQSQVSSLAEQVRELSHRLHPAILDHLGLVSAVRSECRAFGTREGVVVDCSASDVPGSLPREVALCLYRVLQEALRNVARHARASRVEVGLQGTPDGLELSIRDDGVGFRAGPLGAGPGLGLVSMEERVRLVGGSLRVESAPWAGTHVVAWVPHPEEEAPGEGAESTGDALRQGVVASGPAPDPAEETP